MKNIDSINHVTGKSVYLDDIPTLNGTLYAIVLGTEIAHGKLTHYDDSEAQKQEGVVKIITFHDITGENQIGGIVNDEPLLVETDVHFHSQAVAIVVATSAFNARKAAKKIVVEYEEQTPILDPREAQAKGELLIPSRTFNIGDVDSCWKKCAHVFEGRVDMCGQEHLYLETQGAFAYMLDSGIIKVHSSTQGPTAVQKTIARVVGLPMNMVEIDVARLGGGFGGKEDQANGFAAMTALAAYITGKPVKMVLSRHDDLRMTGKRHPYSADYKIGLDNNLKIVGYEVTMYQDGGAATDLSPAIMERSLFHTDNAYFVPNSRSTVHCCRTNTPPNTAFRGFGAPQSIFVIESAIARAAQELGVLASQIQKKNLLNEGDEFIYGQLAENATIRECYSTAEAKFDIKGLQAMVDQYNSQHKNSKQGMAITPLCFGISFTNTTMNQARALVHIYQDGSVSVSTGVIEMGQGVNTKLTQIVHKMLGIGVDRVKIHSTNTSRVANTSPTAASSGADLNGNALIVALNALIGRLKPVASEILGCECSQITFFDNKATGTGNKFIDWNELIKTAFLKRICLSENGHYATPIIYFDKTKEKGHPFAYHVYGVCITTSTVDCIRGTYDIDDVLIVHDFGNSINPTIDKGQIEGGVVQGIGWSTIEELRFSDKGVLLANTLSAYKVPDIYSAPKRIVCEALETDGPLLAVMKSKAVGEPPFVYGISAYFAIQNAIKAYNPKYRVDFTLPLTHEKVLMRLK